MPFNFGIHEANVAGPATHALIIGVGAYPHLVGGAGRLLTDNEGLGQLSSPPQSARHFANWLISDFSNHLKPLATVAMLLSDADNVAGRVSQFVNPRARQAYDLGRARIDNIQIAVDEWKARADSDPDNLTIFYFCGHGTAQGADASLMVEDYGALNNNAIDGAIDFRRFHLGMMRCAASQQCYFIDACRASSDSLIENYGSAGRPLIQSARYARRNLPNRQAPVFYSTLGGALSYARVGKPSVFTEALVKSFAGAGADDADGQWQVTSTRLIEALDYYMRRDSPNGSSLVQVPATGDTSKMVFHEVAVPKIPVEVSCRPLAAAERATLGCIPANGGQAVTRAAPCAEKWFVELMPGVYDFTAEFEADEYPRTKKSDFVHPPYRRVSLEVGP